MSQKWMGKNPSGNPALPQGEFAQLVVEELAKRNKAASSVTAVEQIIRARLTERQTDLMPTQLAFLADPSKRKAAICTRRAGKTFVYKQMLAEQVLNNPWSDRNRSQPIVQYIAPTRQKAVDLAWNPFKAFCEQLGLEAHWNDHELRANFVNGCLVRMGGADDRAELEKYRGDAYRFVGIDEPAAMGAKVEGFVVEIIMPALMDYDAPLVFTGTPGEAQAGYFWKIYSGQLTEYTVHKWSFMTNVHMPAEKRTIEFIEKDTGLPWTDPKIQREYAGNWVADTNTLVYRFDSAKNKYSGPLPEGHDWKYLLGMDLGFHDPTAFVVGAYAKTHPDLFIVRAEAFPHLLPYQIAEHIQQLLGQFGRFTRIVCDSGGSMARSNIEEWNRRWGFGILGAEKTRKFDFIEHMNSELALGRVKIPEGCPLEDEWSQLVWEAADPDSVRTDRKRQEHSGFQNHMSDACLYMFRESMHWRSKSSAPEPVPGSYEALHRAELDAKTKALKAVGKSKKGFVYERLKNDV